VSGSHEFRVGSREKWCYMSILLHSVPYYNIDWMLMLRHLWCRCSITVVIVIHYAGGQNVNFSMESWQIFVMT